jgi:hypothetical protein
MSEELVADEFKDEVDEGKNSISNELITTCSNKAYKDMYVVSILLLLNEKNIIYFLNLTQSYLLTINTC